MQQANILQNEPNAGTSDYHLMHSANRLADQDHEAHSGINDHDPTAAIMEGVAQIGAQQRHDGGAADYLSLAQRSPQRFIRMLMKVLKLEERSPGARHQILQDPKTQPPNEFVGAVLFAAATCGYNGRGKRGLLGYLQMLAQRFPRPYGRLLLLILQQQSRQQILALEKEREKYVGKRHARSVSKKLLNSNHTDEEDQNLYTEPAPALSLAESILLAAARVGWNGRGEGREVGYMAALMRKDRNLAVNMFIQILDLEENLRRIGPVETLTLTMEMVDKVSKLSPDELKDGDKVRSCFGLFPEPESCFDLSSEPESDFGVSPERTSDRMEKFVITEEMIQKLLELAPEDQKDRKKLLSCLGLED